MIDKYLSLFNKSGKVFRALFYDPDRTEKSKIQNINDINKGAIYNGIEWHYRYVKRLVDEFPLTNASGFLLNAWGEFLGVNNDSGLSDNEYRAKVLSKLLSIVGTLPAIKNLIKDLDHVEIKEAQDLGFFLNVSHLDTPVLRNKPFGSVLTHHTNAIYIIFNTIFDIDALLLRTIYQIKCAGIGAFAGVINEYPEFSHLHLDNGFLDKDFIGENQ
ncbi:MULTISPECIES: hypothetical protein [Leptospira]|uniref:Uncharacterized protein n=1 Tax=Leptospira interrogans str. UI 12758 TaxID=1049938 RepID=A0A0E2DNH2_LEPIR|nr:MULTISPECIES: hypothetical protein [Leptospira]EKR57197.1 hypothetical protein LEP1GSC105_0109 [Leptospira interrogans str. UI 12758]EKR82609.1 hypothetical protein LEP1GSC099_1387 [Leptospira interrogans str. UI 08452]EMJ48634.1 hypothetical protein LEP1GSC111_0002 [Leptospira interrogans str. UT126]EMN33168.1 hypothetical protein LEP1GSC084_1116 [Leptospira interrogans serovar Medanensis str. L0448]UML78901.1 hypothetical protein FH602_02070 [Leptospira kirschneri]